MFLRRLVCAVVAAVFLSFTPAAVLADGASTYADAGAQATTTLLTVFYAGDGLWRVCNHTACPRAKADWGVDSALYALALRWATTPDAAIRRAAADLLATAPHYAGPCAKAPCPAWSDTPAWDAVAFMREYAILGDPVALRRAQAAFRYASESSAFTGGACAEVPYQQERGRGHSVKTLETDANLVKAALLLDEATHDARYLERARTRYANDRTFFLAQKAPLYTVHVVDDGTLCVQQRRRFFASVNGTMIWDGLTLARLTGEASYREQALETAHAVVDDLSDERGVFVDLGGENDVVEPLVEAMTLLAADPDGGFARRWVLTNAAAALSSRAADGTFARFFDGPPQPSSSIWESNGGLALEIAAAQLAPDEDAASLPAWSTSTSGADDLTTLPATITFEGSGIALVGTIGRQCEGAHLRVFVDGVPTFDETGMWQNPAMPQQSAVRFVWRWPTAGTHTIRVEASAAGTTNTDLMQLHSIVLQP